MDIYLILPFLIYSAIFGNTAVDAAEVLRIERDVSFQMECCLCNDFDNDPNNDCTERRCYKDLVSSRRKLIVQCEYCQYTKVYSGGAWKMMGECSVEPLCKHDFSRSVATPGCFGTGTPSEDTTCYYCCRRPDVLSPNEYCINDTMTKYTKFLKFNGASQAPPLASSTHVATAIHSTTVMTTPLQNGCSVCDSRTNTNCNDQIAACDTGKCQNRLTFDAAGKQTHIVKSCVPEVLCNINTQTNDVVRCNPFFANKASPNGIVCTYCCDPKSSTSPCNTDAVIRTHSTSPPLLASSTPAIESSVTSSTTVSKTLSTSVATTPLQNGCSVCDSRTDTNCNDKVAACDTGKCQNRLTFDPTGKQTHIVKSCVPEVLCNINTQTNDVVRCNPFFTNKASPNGIVCTYCCDPKLSTSPCNTDAIIRTQSTSPPLITTSISAVTQTSVTVPITQTTIAVTTPLQNGCSVCDSRSDTNCNDKVDACDTGKCQNRLTFDSTGKQTHIVKSCVPEVLCNINTQTNDVVRCNPFFANKASPNGIVCTYCCDPKSSTSPCNTDAVIRTHSTSRLRMMQPSPRNIPIYRVLSTKIQEECCICDDFDNDQSNDCSETRCLSDLYSSTRQLISQCEYCQFTQLFSGSRWKTKVQCSVRSLCEHDNARTEGTPGCFGQGTPAQESTCSYCCRKPDAQMPIDYCINGTLTGYTKFTRFPNAMTVPPLALSTATTQITSGCSVCIDEHGKNCNDKTTTCDGRCQNRLIYDRAGSLIYVSKSCALATECAQNIGSNDIVRCSPFMANKASPNGIICTYCCDPKSSICNTALVPPNHPATAVTTPVTSTQITSITTSSASPSTASTTTTQTSTTSTTMTTKVTTRPVTSTTSAVPSSSQPANFTNMCTVCVGDHGVNCVEPVSTCEWKCQNRLVYNKDGSLLFVSKSCAVETECALNIGINDAIRCSPFMINKASPGGIICTYCCDPKLPSATCNAGLTPRPGTMYVPTQSTTTSSKTTTPFTSSTTKPSSQGSSVPVGSSILTNTQSSKTSSLPTSSTTLRATTDSSSTSAYPSSSSTTTDRPSSTSFAIPTLPKSTATLKTMSSNSQQTMTTSKSSLETSSLSTGASTSSLGTQTISSVTPQSSFTSYTMSSGITTSSVLTNIMSSRTSKTTGTMKSSLKTDTTLTESLKTSIMTNAMSTATQKTSIATNKLSTGIPTSSFIPNTKSTETPKSSTGSLKTSISTNTGTTGTPKTTTLTNTGTTEAPKITTLPNTGTTGTPKITTFTNSGTTGTPKITTFTNSGTTGTPKITTFTNSGTTGTPKITTFTNSGTTGTPKITTFTNSGTTGTPKITTFTNTGTTGTPQTTISTNTGTTEAPKTTTLTNTGTTGAPKTTTLKDTGTTGALKTSLTTIAGTIGTPKPSFITHTGTTVSHSTTLTGTNEYPTSSLTPITETSETSKTSITTNLLSARTPTIQFTTIQQSTQTPKSPTSTNAMSTGNPESSPPTSAVETTSSNSILSTSNTLNTTDNFNVSNSFETTENPYDMTTTDSAKCCSVCINDQGGNCNDTVAKCSGVCQNRLLYNKDGSLTLVSKSCADETECNLNMKVNDMIRCNSTTIDKSSPNGIICTYCCDPASSSLACNLDLVPSV